jgi:Fur family transcriptional regulator, ferric uptake regulator
MPHTADLLRASGFRATPGRVRILEVLRDSEEHFSVADLAKRLRHSVDTVTLYRALEDLEKAGLVRRLDLQHGHAHYEFADDSAHHHHLICRLCGKVEDVANCEPERLETRVLKNSKSFASIETHAMEFFGVCKSCIKKH